MAVVLSSKDECVAFLPNGDIWNDKNPKHSSPNKNNHGELLEE